MNLKIYSVGIDISQKDFTACLCIKDYKNELSYSSIERFSNDKKGFNQLMRWTRKGLKEEVDLHFLMEATGVYYENLAYHLHALNQQVHVVLPNMSKHFFSSLNIKTKTDEVDARILSRMGADRKLSLWQPPSSILLKLRNLTRYYVQLQEQKTALSNMLHGKEASHEVDAFILKSNKGLVDQIDKQIAQSVKQINQVIESDAELKEKVRKLNTIKGVGIITIATIIAETLGFSQVRNAKQLVSYAGYDVVQRESGTSIKGKTRISKKGNRYIRKALYFPAMVSCRFNPLLKESYIRIITKKPSKMVGQVAIQRKLLVLLYSLWRNDTEYIEGYKQSSPHPKAEATQDSSVELLSVNQK